MNAYVFNRRPDIFRRIGVAGFAFFLIKGVLWLAAPFVFAWLI